MRIKTLMEKHGATYSHSSTQVNLPQSFAQEVMRWTKENIDEIHIYNNARDEYGLEDEIHCTVLWGINEEKPKVTKKIVGKFKPFSVSLHNITKFATEDMYDVIRIDVIGNELIDLHHTIADSVDNEQAFSHYMPHITLGYVDPGSCDYLLGNTYFRGRKFRVNAIVFSSKTGHKIPLRFRNGN